MSNKQEMPPATIELIEAVFAGDSRTARSLILRGADPNVDIDGTSLLHVAVQAFDREMIRCLCMGGADLYRIDDRGDTPIALASTICTTKKQIETLTEALSWETERHRNTNAAAAKNPLDLALRVRNRRAVEVLVSSGYAPSTIQAGATLEHLSRESGARQI